MPFICLLHSVSVSLNECLNQGKLIYYYKVLIFNLDLQNSLSNIIKLQGL